jgi:hypothetical protein
LAPPALGPRLGHRARCTPPNCLPGRLPLPPLGCAPTPGEPATPPHPPRRHTRYHAPAPHLRDAPPGMTQRAARWAAPLPRAPGLPLAGPARPLDPRHGTPPPDTGSPPTHGPVLAAVPPLRRCGTCCRWTGHGGVRRPPTAGGHTCPASRAPPRGPCPAGRGPPHDCRTWAGPVCGVPLDSHGTGATVSGVPQTWAGEGVPPGMSRTGRGLTPLPHPPRRLARGMCQRPDTLG